MCLNREKRETKSGEISNKSSFLLLNKQNTNKSLFGLSSSFSLSVSLSQYGAPIIAKIQLRAGRDAGYINARVVLIRDENESCPRHENSIGITNFLRKYLVAHNRTNERV